MGLSVDELAPHRSGENCTAKLALLSERMWPPPVDLIPSMFEHMLCKQHTIICEPLILILDNIGGDRGHEGNRINQRGEQDTEPILNEVCPQGQNEV